MALDYKPHAKQAAAHKAFLVDGYKRGCLFWGRQSGKSIFGFKHMELAACYKQGQYFVIFNTHKHAKDVMWRQYLHSIPKEMIYETNATELTITFNYIKGPFYIPGKGWQAVIHDEEKPRSSIQLLGSDYADDHRGRKADGLMFDEYQDQDPGNWEAVYKFFLTTTKGWACFMGTAKGYNHWYDLLEYAKQENHQRWFYQEATWRDSPFIDAEWIESEKAEAEDTGQLDVFMQEVELQFRTAQGSVFPLFDRNTHVIKPLDKRIPIDGTLYGAWDFGYAEGHPMAYNNVLIDGQGRWFVVDEIHGTGMHIDEMVEQIKTKVAGRKETGNLMMGIVADSARPDHIDLSRSKGLSVLPSPKRQGAIQVGISLLAAKIKPKIQLSGNPEPDLYVAENCKHTLYQLENYRYREHKKDRPISDVPLKVDDDHPDALRYLALYLKYGLVEKRGKIKSGIKTNQYGLLKA